MSTPSGEAGGHTLQPAGESITCGPAAARCTRESTQRSQSAAEILAWLERHGTQVLLQQLPPSRRRRKNRVIVGFRRPGGAVDAAGGATIRNAVEKAIARLEVCHG